MNPATLRIASSVAAATIAFVPLAAAAQPAETIAGTIASVQNTNHVFLNDDRGYVDDVTIRTSADVAANGVRLVPGERVRITGNADRGTFVANSITSLVPSYASAEAPYATAAYYPAPVYPAPVFYPARYYPAFPVSVGLFFHVR